MSEHDEHDHELVMPFVVVTSRGGPYDDDSYVGGYRAGQIDQALATMPVTHGPLSAVHQATVRTADLPQLELIAMRHGYTLTSAPIEMLDEWMHVAFEKVGADA